MNWFCIIHTNSVWSIIGPVKLVSHDTKYHVRMSDGNVYPVNHCFKTKGGASKAIYRRNYDQKGITNER